MGKFQFLYMYKFLNLILNRILPRETVAPHEEGGGEPICAKRIKNMVIKSTILVLVVTIFQDLTKFTKSSLLSFQMHRTRSEPLENLRLHA